MANIEGIRNISLIGHGGSGKTTLAEAILYNTGLADRLGSVDAGNTLTDYEPEELAKQFTIYNSVATVEHKKTEFNFIVTPGYADFEGEVIAGLSVSENALMVLNAVAGVEIQTEKYFKAVKKMDLPLIFVINKMDKENANFNKCINELRSNLSNSIVPLQIPIGSAGDFKGFIDVLKNKAYEYVKDTKGEIKEIEIPSELADEVVSWKNQIIEAAAESSDELTEKFLEGEELTQEEVYKGIREGIKKASLMPVFVSAAAQNFGVVQLLDNLVELSLNPKQGKVKKAVNSSEEEIEVESDESKPFAGQIFKSTIEPHVGELSLIRVYSGKIKSGDDVYNSVKGKKERIGQINKLAGKNKKDTKELSAGEIGALIKLKESVTNDTLCSDSNKIKLQPINFPKPVISMALVPKTKSDQEKLSSAMHKLLVEDLTFTTAFNPEFGQTIVSAMGEMHIDIILEKLKRKYNVNVDLVKPKIAYRETIRKRVERIEGKYKKQSGGRGQYGHCFINMYPLNRGEQFKFEDKIFGGAIPGKYIPPVEKGIQDAMLKGFLAGYPVVDIGVELVDGSYHNVDSSDLAFQIAGSFAFKKAMEQGQCYLLEPVMKVAITVPDSNTGDVMGDINSRRGRILGMNPAEKGEQEIVANIPEAELYKYATDLRSITQGRGTFSMEFSHYEEVPSHITEKIIAESQKQESEE